jgi:ubiquinone/menaquinone biosynthesis C-methylase UbiE
MNGQLHLLPEEALVKTGPVDHADWNFRPVLGAIQRARFRLLVDLFAGRRFDRLLEVGYGSGVFLPELARRSRELHGIDIHREPDRVMVRLASRDVRATLATASAEAMPYDDDFFDAVVAVSSFEFIEDLDRACLEIRRVLARRGAFFVVTPGDSPILDAGLKLLTGADARSDYGEGRKKVMPALERHFRVDAVRTFPRALFPIYRGMRLVEKD